MPMHPELRRSFIGRTRALEGSLRRLVHEIMEELPDDAQNRLRYVNSKIDLLFGDIEELTDLDGSNPAAVRDHEINELRRDFDEVSVLQAALKRRRRDVSRRRQDLSMEEQKLHARQLEEEMEAELGKGQGD